jgi:hypothetical protein
VDREFTLMRCVGAIRPKSNMYWRSNRRIERSICYARAQLFELDYPVIELDARSEGRIRRALNLGTVDRSSIRNFLRRRTHQAVYSLVSTGHYNWTKVQ